MPTALNHMANRWPDTWRSRRWSKGVYTAPGSYFVTICTGRRLCIFGTIEDHQMRLSREGETVHDAWCNLPAHFPRVTLDAFVIMPNHLHGVLNFETEGQSLGTVVGGFKSAVSRTLGKRHWQRYFYDHVIRSAKELAQIRGYIETNPANWLTDQDHRP